MEPIQADIVYRRQKAVGNWLLIGVGMIVIQVLLGGITRLTESGLSITEWKPITGILPPMSEAAWQELFNKYQTTDQFKYVHAHFSMSDFKLIFFWEWFHRVWARLMGLVFLVGFIYFLVKRYFSKDMIWPLVLLFVLGGVQGFIGWIMVASGLVPEKYYVGHVELTTHFIGALFLLSYTLWFALRLRVRPGQELVSGVWRKRLIGLGVVIFFQLIYGGFMAGLKAAITAPTWPTINGAWIPPVDWSEGGLLYLLSFNPLWVHVIHRSLAYIIGLLVVAGWFASRQLFTGFAGRLRHGLLGVTLAQVLLGILTVVNATNDTALLWLGVAHQFTAMLLVMIWVTLLYVVRKSPLRQSNSVTS